MREYVIENSPSRTEVAWIGSFRSIWSWNFRGYPCVRPPVSLTSLFILIRVLCPLLPLVSRWQLKRSYVSEAGWDVCRRKLSLSPANRERSCSRFFQNKSGGNCEIHREANIREYYLEIECFCDGRSFFPASYYAKFLSRILIDNGFRFTGIFAQYF